MITRPARIFNVILPSRDRSTRYSARRAAVANHLDDRGGARNDLACHWLIASAQVLGEEFFRSRHEIHVVGGTDEAVALVRIEQVFDSAPVFLDGRDNLLGFDLSYSRIGGALGDEQRNPNAVCGEQWCR